jgi:uncharacterized RDD family membrane protein YckC
MSETAFAYRPASLVKRLVAIFYDLLLLVALLFTVGVVVAGIVTFAINDGHAITPEHHAYTLYRIFILGILLLTGLLFYGWFWVHGGQTLGMKTWRLQLKSADGGNLNWKMATIRYFGAIISWLCLGLGYLWSLLDPHRRSWHDILSATVVVQLKK